MNNNIRTEIVRTVAEIGPGPFTLFFLWSLFDLAPATVPNLESMIRAQYSRPTIRSYLRKLESLGLISGSASGLWVPSAAGKNFFSLNSINDSIILIPPNKEINTINQEKVFPDPKRDGILEILSAFGVMDPNRTRIADTIPISPRDLFNLAFNLLDDCSNSPKLTFAPGLLIYNLRSWSGDPVPLRANPYRYVHSDYCSCSGCSPLTGTGDPVSASLDPRSDTFDPLEFIRTERIRNAR